MDITCSIVSSHDITTQVCKHILFNTVPTSAILKLNTAAWCDQHKKITTRTDLARQMSVYYTWRQNECAFPESYITHNIEALFTNSLDVVLHYVYCSLKLINRLFVEQRMTRRHVSQQHMPVVIMTDDDAHSVLVVLRDLPIISNCCKELTIEHTTQNPFLISTVPFKTKTSIHVQLDVAAVDDDTKEIQVVVDTVVTDEAVHTKIDEKTKQLQTAQQKLYTELHTVLKQKNISGQLINLQVNGFLNINAKPRPNISNNRRKFWELSFEGVDTAKNPVGTVLAMVALQYNIFIEGCSDPISTRIGHICKLFSNYTLVHRLIRSVFAEKYEGYTNNTIGLRYNQLLANFRMYLRKNFARGCFEHKK